MHQRPRLKSPRSHFDRFDRIAAFAVAAVLGLTAILKIASLWLLSRGPAGAILRALDPLLPFSLCEGDVVWFSVAIETPLIILFLGGKRSSIRQYRYAVLAWMAATFSVYHYFALRLGRPCNCTGVWDAANLLTDPLLGLVLLSIILVIGVVGSVLAIAMHRTQKGVMV